MYSCLHSRALKQRFLQPDVMSSSVSLHSARSCKNTFISKSDLFSFSPKQGIFFYLFFRFLPGLNESVASVGHVFHLEVDGCIQGGHDHSVVKVQTGCVHEI